MLLYDAFKIWPKQGILIHLPTLLNSLLSSNAPFMPYSVSIGSSRGLGTEDYKHYDLRAVTPKIASS